MYIHLDERSLQKWCHTLEDKQMALQIAKIRSSWAFEDPILRFFSPRQAQWILLRKEVIGEPMRRQWLARMFRRAAVYGRLETDVISVLPAIEDPAMRVGLTTRTWIHDCATRDLYEGYFDRPNYTLAYKTLESIVDSIDTGLFPRAAISHLMDLSTDEDSASLIDTIEFDLKLRKSIEENRKVEAK